MLKNFSAGSMRGKICGSQAHPSTLLNLDLYICTDSWTKAADRLINIGLSILSPVPFPSCFLLSLFQFVYLSLSLSMVLKV